MKIRNGIIFFLFLTSPFVLFGQTEIQGTIYDEKGDPVIGANVFIEGSYSGSSSDQEGHFSFEFDVKGAHILVVKFMGYQDVHLPIDIAEDSIEVRVNLIEETNQMDI